MGNRHVENGPIGVINPSEHPYLHIMKLPRDSGASEWEYVPQLSGMELGVEQIRNSNGEGFSRIQYDLLDISLLPLVDQTHVPPGPIDAEQLARQAIEKRTEEIREALDRAGEANALTFSHGYGWGTLPLKMVASLIADRYQISGTPFQIAGRKKMQTNAVGIIRI